MNWASALVKHHKRAMKMRYASATHLPMDGSVAIHLSTQALEELLYEKDKLVSLTVDVDGTETEITIKKKKEWK